MLANDSADDRDTLVRIGSAAVPQLIEAAGYRTPATRKRTAEALGQIHDWSAIPTLQRLKYDPDPKVRKAAENALANTPASPVPINPTR